ncbi:MAG: TetR/AcrR family transcriptional regulator [Bacteroidia bacterium]
MNDSKGHILITSLNLFLQKGFKEVTMKEIVDTTGLSKGAFYHYFNSKEQVFAEVMDHFYSELIITHYDKFSQTSLHQFYIDYLTNKNEKIASSKIIDANKEKIFTSNHYFLVFDAIKLLPNFKKQRTEQRQTELKAWIKIIRTAKKSGEIETKMGDEQIAKLFIYSAKGSGISCIMDDDYGKTRQEIKKIWTELYNSLRK